MGFSLTIFFFVLAYPYKILVIQTSIELILVPNETKFYSLQKRPELVYKPLFEKVRKTKAENVCLKYEFLCFQN